MGKHKKQEAVFLDVFKDFNGKETYSPTRKSKALVDDGVNGEKKEVEIDVPNEKMNYYKGVNRKARRIIAKQNRAR